MSVPPLPPGSDPKPKRRGLPMALRVFMGVLGTLMSLISFPLTAFALFELLRGTGNAGGNILVGVFFGVMAVAALPLLYMAFKRAPKAPVLSQEHERWVLDVARQNDGVVTAPLLAVDSQLSVDQSIAALEMMRERGLAQRNVNEMGETLYVFPSFYTSPARVTARTQIDMDDFDRRLSESGVSLDFDSADAEQVQPHYQAPNGPWTGGE